MSGNGYEVEHMDPVLYALLNGKVSSVESKVNAISSGFSYKGSVNTKSSLPSNASIGDVYTVSDENNLKYAWDGTEWIKIDTDSDHSLKNKKILLIGDSYNYGNGGIEGHGWGYYFNQYSGANGTIIHQNGGGFAAPGNDNASYPNKIYTEIIDYITDEYDLIIAQAGWNDASDGRNPDGITAIQAGVSSFISAVKVKFPNADIVIVGTNNGTKCTYQKAKKLRAIVDTALKNRAKACYSMPLWMNGENNSASDGIHLTDDGYQKLGTFILDYVNGWDGSKETYYYYESSDKLTPTGVTAPGSVKVYFNNTTAFISFDVTLTTTLSTNTTLIENLPVPVNTLISTVGNWQATFKRAIRAFINTNGTFSLQYGESGNYRVFMSYPITW